MVRLDEMINMSGHRGFARIWDEKDFRFGRRWRQNFFSAFWLLPATKVLTFSIDRTITAAKSALWGGERAFTEILNSTRGFHVTSQVFRSPFQAVICFPVAFTLQESLETPGEVIEKRLMKSVFTGGFAGVLSTLIMYPLESSHKFLLIDEGRNRQRYFSIYKALEFRYSHGGPPVIYKGMVPALIGSFIYRSCYFTSYIGLKEYFNNPTDFLNLYTIGVAASLFAGVAAHPLEAAKMHMMNRTFDNIFRLENVGSFEFIMRHLKFNQLFTGIHLTMAKSFSSAFPIVFFDMYTRWRYSPREPIPEDDIRMIFEKYTVWTTRPQRQEVLERKPLSEDDPKAVFYRNTAWKSNREIREYEIEGKNK